MAFAIPRIQYKNVDTTGNTSSGSGTISSVNPTTNIEVGMFVRGTGIPAGATVGSKTSNSVTLAGGVLATANGTGVALSFGYEILFVYPPIEPDGPILDTKQTTSESLSGRQQVSVNYVEEVRRFKFSFLSQSLYNSVDTFLRTWGILGKSFRYFENQTLSSYVEYELNALKVNPKKLASKGVDVYVWEVPLEFRRVL